MRSKFTKKRFLLSFIVAIILYCVVVHLCYYHPTSCLKETSKEGQDHIDNELLTVMAIQKQRSPHNDLELYLRMTTANPIFTKLYKSVLVQSMSYFWPSNFSMVVVLDQEKPEDHTFGDDVITQFPYPRTCFMSVSAVAKYTDKDRMQRDMFYPDKCTSKKFVGYIDTDTMFISRITPEILFAGEKPIIVGIYGNVSHNFWSTVSHSTAKMFKTKEVMRCMSYFPLILKVEHVVKLREYLAKLHNMSFEEVLHSVRARYISQFNIMCQYVWMFHRDEYKFHLQLQPTVVPNVSSEYRESPKYYSEMLRTEQISPIARPTTHFKYVAGGWKNQNTYTRLFKSSVCFAGGFEVCPEKCKTYKKDTLRKEMFYFDYMDWSWDKRCLAAQLEHYKTIAKYNDLKYREIIHKACNEVESLVWSV